MQPGVWRHAAAGGGMAPSVPVVTGLDMPDALARARALKPQADPARVTAYLAAIEAARIEAEASAEATGD